VAAFGTGGWAPRSCSLDTGLHPQSSARNGTQLFGSGHHPGISGDGWPPRNKAIGGLPCFLPVAVSPVQRGTPPGVAFAIGHAERPPRSGRRSAPLVPVMKMSIVPVGLEGADKAISAPGRVPENSKRYKQLLTVIVECGPTAWGKRARPPVTQGAAWPARCGSDPGRRSLNRQAVRNQCLVSLLRLTATPRKIWPRWDPHPVAEISVQAALAELPRSRRRTRCARGISTLQGPSLRVLRPTSARRLRRRRRRKFMLAPQATATRGVRPCSHGRCTSAFRAGHGQGTGRASKDRAGSSTSLSPHRSHPFHRSPWRPRSAGQLKGVNAPLRAPHAVGDKPTC